MNLVKSCKRGSFFGTPSASMTASSVRMVSCNSRCNTGGSCKIIPISPGTCSSVSSLSCTSCTRLILPPSSLSFPSFFASAFFAPKPTIRNRVGFVFVGFFTVLLLAFFTALSIKLPISLRRLPSRYLSRMHASMSHAKR